MSCPAAQRLSEVHVVTGAGVETVTGGLLMKTVETTGATGLEDRGANGFEAGFVQFSGEEITALVTLMVSPGGGSDGCVAQPASRSSAPQKRIPACVAEAAPA
jgi:hypothetical protein